MNLIVYPSGFADWNGQHYQCALGAGGTADQKQEGDHVTPAGKFLLRRVFFRSDRIERPHTLLPVSALTRRDGWSDDPDDFRYNQQITLPYSGSHELLWRIDAVYDLVAVVGYNDRPVVPGCGSAIFLHIANPDYGATEGCIAFALSDFSRILNEWEETSTLDIRTET